MARSEDILSQVLTSLKDGPYACSSLEKLAGGTANFVYRGVLTNPLEDASKTVVIKYTPPYVAGNPSFKLTETRCGFEQTIGLALDALPPSIHNNITIETPRLYHFFPEIHTQIYSDLSSSIDLKSYVINHPLTQAECHRIGQSVGVWAKKFHLWAAAPEQQKLREDMKGNVSMKDLKFWLNYGPNLTGTIEKFPDQLGGSREVFESTGREIQASLERGEGTLIHGDFWSGNVLLPDALLPHPEQPLKMYTIDWELSHAPGLISFDLGQIIGDLFEMKHFRGLEAGFWLIEAFMEGYGKIDDILAFKTATHVGAHLMCWGTRGPGKGTREQAEAIVEIGRDFFVKGCEKNRGFFNGTVLRCLFA